MNGATPPGWVAVPGLAVSVDEECWTAACAVVTSAGMTVRVWTVGGASVTAVPLPVGPVPVSVAVALRPPVVMVAAAVGTELHRWTSSNIGRTLEALPVVPAPVPVQSVAVTPDGDLLMACADGTVRWHRAQDGVVSGVSHALGHVRALALDPSDPHAAVLIADDGRLLRLWGEDRPASADVPAPVRVAAAALSSQGVVVCDGAEVLRRVDDSWLPLVLPGAPVVSLALDRTGQLLFTAHEDGSATLGALDGASGRQALPGTLSGPATTSHGHALGPVQDRFDADIDRDASTAPVEVVVEHVPRPADAAGDLEELLALRPDGDLHPDTQPERAGSLLDDDVQVSVYRPARLTPAAWETMLVFAHKQDPVVDARGVPVDPFTEVQAHVVREFGRQRVSGTTGDARFPLARGTALRVEVDLPGLEVNPATAHFSWEEPVHSVRFRVRAPSSTAGSSVRGSVRIWCGPLVLAELGLTLPVANAADAVSASAAPVVERLTQYAKIFPSYSHQDTELVSAVVEAAAALGHTYLQDCVVLRSGEQWSERLLELIDEADVFQLFWSSNSMRSPYCRQEWERALSLSRPRFVRPLYWEEPMPEEPAAGLPPAALRALHFARLERLASVAAPVVPSPPAPPPPTASTVPPGAPARPGSAAAPAYRRVPPPPVAAAEHRLLQLPAQSVGPPATRQIATTAALLLLLVAVVALVVVLV